MSGRIIGGILLTLGTLVSLAALVPIIALSWRIWEGSTPDFIMVSGGNGELAMSPWQFLGVCGVVLLVALVCVGIGIQFCFRSSSRE